MGTIILAIAALLAAFLAGRALGPAPAGKRQEAPPPAQPRGKKRQTEDDRSKPRISASKLIALGVLVVDGTCTYIVLYLCYISIRLQYSGSLPYLTTLIGALQAVTGVVLTAYYNKAKAENTKGGIVYDAAMWSESDHGDL